MVDALSVAEAKYKAALNVLPVLVVKLCVAVSSSPRNEVHMLWVFAILYPYAISAASANSAGEVFRVTCTER